MISTTPIVRPQTEAINVNAGTNISCAYQITNERKPTEERYSHLALIQYLAATGRTSVT
jgi:hypothetical protein